MSEIEPAFCPPLRLFIRIRYRPMIAAHTRWKAAEERKERAPLRFLFCTRRLAQSEALPFCGYRFKILREASSQFSTEAPVAWK